MATELQRAANRMNAKRSTGPMTALGKARASTNALRHGLAAQRRCNAADGQRIEQLADRIVRASCGQISLLRARSIAVAQLELEKARAVEASLLQRICGNNSAEFDPMNRNSALNGLTKIQRYLDRSQSRRDLLFGGALSAKAQNEPNF